MEETELQILQKLYTSLLDIGQDNQLPVKKIDYVKARVFDATIMLKRLGYIKNDTFVSNCQK